MWNKMKIIVTFNLFTRAQVGHIAPRRMPLVQQVMDGE